MGRHHMLKPKLERMDQIEMNTAEENPLISKAKHVIRSNLGIDNPDDLADRNFVWINPFVDEPVGKEDYVAAGRYFNLRSAFPDLDYRSYDFRVDPDDSFTIRCTCRVIGTLQEGLQLRDEVLSPNGRIMICPPEGISLTFDPVSMKVTKLCTGFCLDRQVGNTGGCTGIQGASVIAGKPMATWKNLPKETALLEVFALRPKRLENPTRGLRSPFPQTVMVQLARGVLSSNMGADDPTLLSDDEFFYVTPLIGPIKKKEYLRHYAEQELEGYDLNFSSLRVDPYEPDRVWVDCRPTAPGFSGPPQVVSFSFDQTGCCNRITTSAVLDPSMGNAGGLGGSEGYKYAMGNYTSDFVSPPVSPKQTKPMIDSLINVGGENGYKETVLQSDEPSSPMKETANGSQKSKDPVRPNMPPPINKMNLVEQKKDVARDEQEIFEEASGTFGVISKKVVSSFTSPSPTGTTPLKQADQRKSGAKKIGNSSQPAQKNARNTLIKPESEIESKRLSLGGFTDSIRIPDFSLTSPPNDSSDQRKHRDEIDESVVKRLDNLKDMTDSIRIVPEHISRSFSLLIDTKTQQEKDAAESRRQAATSKRAEQLKQIANKQKQTPKPTTRDAKLALALKIQAERRARMNREDLLARARVKRDQERQKELRGNAQSLFTSSLLGVKDSTTVARLAKWRRNADGTITGLVSGSTKYKRNEKVTTSPVKRGKIASKEVVQTGSGSRYYLE